MAMKKIPTKNYIILFGLIVLILCACLAFYNIFNIYNENKLNTSPLSSKQVLYEDLKNATKEIDADTFLLISYTQNKKVFNNEKEIKKYLNKNNLMDNVMYLDVTEYMNDENFTEDINKVLKLENNLQVKVFPAIVYYKDGNAAYSVDSSSGLINKGS